MHKIARMHPSASGEMNGEVTNVLSGSKKPFEEMPQDSHVKGFMFVKAGVVIGRVITGPDD